MSKIPFVIKCGGSMLAELPDSFYEDLHTLSAGGSTPVIVHGGGPAISEALEKYGIPSVFVEGLRKTTEEVLDIVEMVLAGKINKEVVRRIGDNGGSAVGLSGVDGRLLTAEPVQSVQDIGFVGEVREVNAALLHQLIDSGYIPVVAPVGLGRDGQRYNINADTAAGAVAAQLGAEQLVVVTDVPGIMKPDEQGQLQVLPVVTVADIHAMIADGTIYGGMIPKVKAAIACLQGEGSEVVIVQGTEPGVLRRLLAGESIGTRIVLR